MTYKFIVQSMQSLSSGMQLAVGHKSKPVVAIIALNTIIELASQKILNLIPYW